MNTKHISSLLTLLVAGCGAETTTIAAGELELDFDGLNLHYSTPNCPVFEEREVLLLSGDIEGFQQWSCDQLPILTGTTFVHSGARLKIAAGTVILGDPGAALISTIPGEIDAIGTELEPIVFTSSLPVGERERGDWGGLVLLGDAPINVPGGTNRIEGIDPSDPRGSYGGTNEAGSCGSLEFIRIEFAGDEFSIDNELNGLTLGGCGSATTIDFVQVHRGLDDGIEFFGGTVNVQHLLITGAKDDSIDWDEGWSGRIDYAIVQQYAGAGDRAIEADNFADDHAALPRSQPTLANITLLGAQEPAGEQIGIVLRRGTGAAFERTIVAGFSQAALDVRDAETATGADAGRLSLRESLFFSNGAAGTAHLEQEPNDGSSRDDDAGFDERSFFREERWQNTYDVDPGLEDPFNPKLPVYAPTDRAPLTLDSGYIGAIDPAGPDWTMGWTAFPTN